MKKGIKLFLLLILLLLGFLPKSFAQAWAWGRKDTGCTIDGWPVVTDAAGNVYGAGTIYWNTAGTPTGIIYFGSGVSLTESYGDAVWVKYDPAGTTQWAGLAHVPSGTAYIMNMATDPSSNLVIFGAILAPSLQIGSYTFTGAGVNGQYFLAKVSPAGTVLWAVASGSGGGGSVTTDDTGNIYITSCFSDSFTMVGPFTLLNSDHTGRSYDVFVAKYTPSGTVVWATSVGAVGPEYVEGIAVNSLGYVYICGNFMTPSFTVGSSVLTDPLSTAYKTYGYVAKFSPAGVPLWGQAIGGRTGTGNTDAGSIAKDNSDNMFVTGYFSDNMVSFGSLTLTPTYPGSFTKSNTFLVQYSSADLPIWGKTLSSLSKNVYSSYVAVPPCGGQVWICGNYQEDASIDAGVTLASLPDPYPLDEGYIVGYNVGGGMVGDMGLGAGAGEDQANIAFDPSGNMFYCADFYRRPCKLVFGADTLTSDEQETFFLAKYTNVTTHDTTYRSNDTSFCNDTSAIHLFAPAGYAAYTWNNGATGRSISISSSGQYVVTCVNCGNVLIDTLNVKVGVSGTVFKNIDTVICSNKGTLLLTAPTGNSSFLWNTGSHTESISVSSPGTYWVFASSGCVAMVDTFRLSSGLSPVVNLGNDTGFCTGNSITLESNQPPGYTFRWNTGSTANTITINTAGSYWLAVDNHNCITTDTINVTESMPPVSVNLGRDTTFCTGDAFLLQVPANATPVLWSNGSNSQVITVSETGTYWVAVSNACGVTGDTIKVSFELCDLWFPSAFTPNGDGLNDIIKVGGNLLPYKNFSLGIYNRWGQQVFYTQDIYSGWDGTFNGVNQELGTFFYLINYTLEGKKHMMKGDFQLIR